MDYQGPVSDDEEINDARKILGMNPLPNDPNGVPWEEYGYTSYEAYIESKAGANPPDYPGEGECVDGYGWPIGMEKPPPFAADDEDDPAPRGDAE